MTFQELTYSVRKLSTEEQLALLELLANLLRAEMRKSEPRRSSVHKVRGLLKPDDGRSPTNEELSNAYTDYLLEKYS